jgi:solute carrier family 25 protein 39/40
MPKDNITSFGNAASGALAGMFAVTMSYPFDLIKTRSHFLVQNAGENEKISLVKVAKNIFQEGASTRGTFRGLTSFYRGLDQLMPEAALKTMLRFFVFKEVQEKYKQLTETDRMTFTGNIVCGAMAGSLETIAVVQPFERGKTLRADFKNPYEIWGKAFKTEGIAVGIRSMYTGFIPCLCRQVGNQAAAFSTFYGLKQRYLESTGNEDLNTLQRMGFGFMAGSVACCFTMPMDVAKSIAQKQTSGQTLGTLSILRKVYSTQGVKGLYAGLTPRIGRVGLDRAFGFLAFEYFVEQLSEMEFFQKQNERDMM